MARPRKIEISHRTIIFTVVFLGVVWFLYFIRDLLLQVFVALLIMTILNPFVTKLEEMKIPRAFSVLLVYLLAFGLVFVAIAGIVPPLVEQTTVLANEVPRYLRDVSNSSLFADRVLGEIFSEIGRLPAQLVRSAISVFSNIIGLVTTLIFAFYLLLSRKKIDEQLGVFFGKKVQKEIARVLDLLERKLGGWVRGQLSLMILVGAFTYVGLLILGFPFALPLSILAGLLEVVPYIGPLIAAIPAVIIGLGISPLSGLAAAALYFLIQQLENYIFVPKVMEKSAGVTPIVTLLALAIGFKIAGIIGVLMSVPVAITIQILLKEYLSVEKAS